MTRLLSCLTLALAVLASGAARADWDYVGAGDCAARDAETSNGAMPARAQCATGMAGMTAVCWDGVKLKRNGSPTPICVYKKVLAEQCKGGANPGSVYRCSNPMAKRAGTAGTPTAQPSNPALPANPNPNPVVAPVAQPAVAGGTNFPAAPGFMWRYAGLGDCSGNDAAGSQGATPGVDRCDQSLQGQVAVCWDGVKAKHHDFADAACTYKTTAVASCKGGANPGAMYECVPSTTANPGYAWRNTGIGDCAGSDVASSEGAMPQPGRCDATTAGKTAVCWDGVAQKHKDFATAACTYKSLPAALCNGGPNPGYLWKCEGAAATGSTTGAPGTTATPGTAAVPAGSPKGWVLVGAGNCAPKEWASSTGGKPVPWRCDAAHAGKAAVCYDGAKRHPSYPNGACLYKTVTQGECTDGSNPGNLYVCNF